MTTEKELKEIDFLHESNKIEREYSDEALEDSIKAWNYARKFIKHKMIDMKMILTVHKILMKRLNPRIAGKLRKVDVQVGSRVCMPYRAVEYHLQELWSDRHPAKTRRGIEEWHILFEKIHPFEDGNGRVGRILMNIQRLKAKLPLLIIHEGKEQLGYYKWFK